jgi:hypothetical protein
MSYEWTIVPAYETVDFNELLEDRRDDVDEVAAR